VDPDGFAPTGPGLGLCPLRKKRSTAELVSLAIGVTVDPDTGVSPRRILALPESRDEHGSN
jgi:hypothetical protein